MSMQPPYNTPTPPPPPGYSNYAPHGGYGGVKPDNYLVWAIVTTVLCCLPFGIVSIVNAAKVDSLWAQGDTAGAQTASQNAKKWAIISAVVGVIVSVLWAVLLVAGANVETTY